MKRELVGARVVAVERYRVRAAAAIHRIGLREAGAQVERLRAGTARQRVATANRKRRVDGLRYPGSVGDVERAAAGERHGAFRRIAEVQRRARGDGDAARVAAT